jgi:hypothetical protein
MSIVKIKTPTELSSGFGTIITTHDDQPIHGVRRAVVTIDVNEVIKAHLDLYCSFEGEAVGTFFVIDPSTGERKQLKLIEFADGSSFEPK